MFILFIIINLIDSDECSEGHGCGMNETCRNFIGGYECVCKSGYAGQPCTGSYNTPSLLLYYIILLFFVFCFFINRYYVLRC